MCILTTGFPIPCNDASGGISEFLFFNHSNITGANTITETNGVITAMTAVDFAHKYVPEKATSTLSDNPQINRENGTRFYAQAANVVLNKMETTKRNEIKLLATALLGIIGKDKQGKYWLMGRESGARMANSESGTGVAMGDRNGYNLNFEAEEVEPLIEVDAAIIEAILA